MIAPSQRDGVFPLKYSDSAAAPFEKKGARNENASGELISRTDEKLEIGI